MAEQEQCPECKRETPKQDGDYCRWCGMSFTGTLRNQLAQAKAENAGLRNDITYGITTFCEGGFPHRWAMRLCNGQTREQHNETQYPSREAAEAAKK